MIEYKMGKDEAPSEFRFVVYFDTKTDMQVELMEDDDIEIIVENNLCGHTLICLGKYTGL